jgi:hypothetical protein
MSKDYYIDLEALSDELIAEQQIEISDLWMLKTGDDKIHGPFSSDMLREYCAEHEDLFEDAYTFNLDSEEWQEFYKTTQFQRRVPKLVPAQSLITHDHFYLLGQGQKQGPFKLDEIKSKLDSGEISLNDQVSVDEGKSWIKVYEHHEFDRRTRQKTSDELPFIPQEEVFKSIDLSTHKHIQELKKKKEEEDALVGLAFISHGNDKGQLMEMPKPDPAEIDEEQEETPDNITELKVPVRRPAWKQMLDKVDWQQLKDKVVDNRKAVVGAFTVVILIVGAMAQFGSGGKDLASEFKQSQRKKRVSRKIDNTGRKYAKRMPAVKEQVKRLEAKKRKRIVRTKKTQPRKPKRIERRPKRGSNNDRYARDRDNYREDYPDDYDNRRDFDMLDIDDPRVRAELSRELAGEYNDEAGNNDRGAGLPMDKDMIDRIENGELTPQMEAELEERLEHYEEVSDFE